MFSKGLETGKPIVWFLYDRNIATEYLKAFKPIEHWSEINPYS